MPFCRLRAVCFIALAAGTLAACTGAPTAPSAQLSTGPYQLDLRVADACNTPTLAAFPFTYSFNGSLTTTGSGFRFTLDPSLARLGMPPLTMDLTVNGNAFAGTMGGGAKDLTGYLLFVSTMHDSVDPAPISGMPLAASTGRGTMDGFLSIVHRVFSISTSCTGRQQWTLTAS